MSLSRLPILLVALALHSFVAAQDRTVLTFQIGSVGNGTPVPDTYGDNVTSASSGTFSYGGSGAYTPNVVTDYLAVGSPNTSYWNGGYSDLVGVIYNDTDNQPGFSVTFTADPGYLVELHGFDLGNWGGAITLPVVRVNNSVAATIFFQSNVVLQGSSGPHLSVDFSPPLVGQSLTIDVDTTGLGGQSDNVGLDNIEIGQVLDLSGGGQPNGPNARLEINGFGTNNTPGPFSITIPSGGGNLFISLLGPVGAPWAILVGPVNAGAGVFPCFGSLDLGTPPLFGDVVIALDGFANPVFSLGPTGTQIQLPVDSTIPPGLFLSVQGFIGQPGSPLCPAILTAAFEITIL